MTQPDNEALDLIFREVRTVSRWSDRAVARETPEALRDLTRMGPTSANCPPMRVTFVASDGAKARLEPHLMAANVEQTMAAPVIAILAYDTTFYEHLPRLFMAEAITWFTSSEEVAHETAFRNATLQGGYFMIAARSLGLDCGPMPGFDQAGFDQMFFSGTSFKSDFLVNLGHGDRTGPDPRSCRFAFDEACEIV